MSTYFSFLERKRYHYSFTYIVSEQLNKLEGSFIIDPSFSINLIKKSELSTFVSIDRSEKYILRNGTINTQGEVKINIGNFIVKFQVVSDNSHTEILGAVGSSFMTETYINYL